MKHTIKKEYIIIITLAMSLLCSCEIHNIEQASCLISISEIGMKDSTTPETRGGLLFDEKVSENIYLFATEEQNTVLFSEEADTKGINTTTATLTRVFGNSGLGIFAEANGADNPVLIDNAKLSAAEGTWDFHEKYYWPDVNSDFYSWAPYAAASLSLGDKSFTFSNSSSVDDQIDLLVSDKMSYPANYDQPLSLEYNHALCEVKFITDENFPKGIMASLKISGLYMTGTYDFADGTWRIPEDSELGDMALVQSHSLPADNNLVASNQVFFVIPQFSTLDTKVELEYKIQGQTEFQTFSVNIPEGYEFKKGSIVTFVLGSGERDYTFKLIDSDDEETDTINFTFDLSSESSESFSIISSYVQNGVERTLSYEAEYSVDGGETWQPFTDSGYYSTGLQAHNDGSVEASEKVLKPKILSESYYLWSKDGIVADNWDLSRMQIGGDGDGTASQNSANCYIVKHPGSYKFPCVYGNSLQDGVLTEAGYKSSVSGENKMNTLFNAFGEPIKEGYIVPDVKDYIEGFDVSNLKAVMVWVDKGGFHFNDLTYSDGYISFSIPSNVMMNLNAQIVLYYDGLPRQYRTSNSDSNGYIYSDDTIISENEKYDEGEALWSWTIWITDLDLSPSSVGEVNHSTWGRHSFMCTELGSYGFSESHHRKYVKYPNITIRLKQNYNPASDYFYITVSAPEIISTRQSAPEFTLYFANGRMTPFDLGGLDRKSWNIWGPTGSYTYYYPQCFQLFTSNIPKSIGNQIKYTQTYQTNGAFTYYVNNWDFGSPSDNYTKKTVYDPCPYGYVVPNVNAISALGTSTQTVLADGIQILDESGEPINSLYFPFRGYFSTLYDREMKKGGLDLWSSTVGYSTDMACNWVYLEENYHFVGHEFYRFDLAPVRPELEVKQ